LGAAVGLIVNGLIALALSLALWEITHSMLGWLALFVPGATLVLYGCWRIFVEVRRE
jgi:hypothetical protein